MIRRLEAGDVVQAVVQGRRMTVVRYDAYDNVVCQWFDAAGLLQEATFSQARLKKVDES
jgi:uncharacterized protein YodC (DUF2158 family)